VNPGACGFDRWLSAPNFYDNDPILSREGKAVVLKGESSVVTADAAAEFIRAQVKAGKPFLAVVWFGSPHLPHQASPEDYAAYARHGEKKANYYGEIAGLDRAVGKLREELRSLGVREDTLLWYCSDNGGIADVSVTGGRKQKGSIYEGGLRVPGIIEWPARIVRPRVTAVPSNTVDIYPNAAKPQPKRENAEEAFSGKNGVVEAPFRSRTPCRTRTRSSSSSLLPLSPYWAAVIE
ncbi:MAG: sulfatase, partial [Gemmatimonadales bacterium]